MTTFVQDLRYALRTLSRSPGFTAAAAATLALGIGANAAVFSVVSAVLIKPLPFPAAERIVRIWSSNPARGLAFFSVSAGDYREWKAQSRSFEAMAAYERQRPAALAARDGAKEVLVAGVSPDLFDLLGVRPAAGRSFAAGEAASPTADAREVILADGFRNRELGEDADAIGRSLTLNGQLYTVVGVMPPGFAIPNNPAELWMRLDLSGETDHGNRFLRVLGRLAPGAGIAQARAELQTIARRLQMHDPGTNQGWDVALRTLAESVIGETFGRSVLILFGVVSIVLLIACANVAGLWIARGASRQREIAVRMAIGASRGRLVRQLLTESAVLGLLAAVLGILVAWGGLDLLRSLAPAAIPRLESVRMDVGVLAFALAVSLLTSVVFGLFPALKLSRPDLNDSLGAGARGFGAARGSRRVRSLLVAGQIGLALVLLIGAGLLIQSLVRLQKLDLGFSPANLITARLTPPEESYPDRERVAAFYRELLERIHEIPGVVSEAAVSLAPLRDPNSANSFFAEGWRPVERSAAPDADFRVVTAGYFETMGIPVRSGRAFSPRDDAGAPAVAVIDQTMARRYWPGADPVGKRLRLGDVANGPWLTIAGVVQDATYGDPTVPVRRPMIYLPLPQTASRGMTLVVRVAPRSAPAAAALRSEVARLDANIPLSTVITMPEAVAFAFAQRRFTLLLFAVFAGLALLLAAVGVYGLVSFLVALRTREMGIRLALGARPADLVALVMGQGFRLSLAGVAAGLAAAAAVTRFLESQLYGTGARDPIPFAVAAASLLAVALLASGLPARRAARVDPIAALRSE